MTKNAQAPYVIVNCYSGEAWTKLVKVPGTFNKFHHVRREYKTLEGAEQYVRAAAARTAAARMPVTEDKAEMTIMPLVQFLIEYGE